MRTYTIGQTIEDTGRSVKEAQLDIWLSEYTDIFPDY
jgi:hypothetical protein